MRRTTLPYCTLLVLLFSIAIVGCSRNKTTTKRPVSVEPEPKGPTAQELFVKGNKQLDKGAWKKAIKTYDDAIEQDPERWEIYMNRGIAQSRVPDFEAALASFELALQHGGTEEPELYFNLGNLYQERGLYSESVDAYRTSLAYRDQPHVDTLVNLGAAYVFLKRWDAADQTYDYIRSIAPDDPRPVHGKGLVRQLQSQYADAIQFYEQAHSIDPNFALSYYNAATCYSRQKNYDEAIRAMQDYIRVDPDGPSVKRAKGLIKLYQQERDKM
jgi:tetratricopeptide (TPR) repeat protein